MTHHDASGGLPIAKALNEVPSILSALPLTSAEQLKSYRVVDEGELRGQGVVEQLEYNLTQVKHAKPYKAFVTGRTGCGKSTELAELRQRLRNAPSGSKVVVVHFDVVDQLDPLNFQPFDVLLVMVERVLDRLKELQTPLPDAELAKNIADWFDSTQVVTTTQTSVGASIEVGVQPPFGQAWATLLGFFMKAQGDAKFSSARERKTVQNALSRLDTLVIAVNKFLQATQAHMEKQELGRLLIVGEGFDKREVPRDLVRQFFLNYGNVLRDLDCPLVFTIPLDLLRSSDAGRLPSGFGAVVMHDVPVYGKTRQAHEDGRRWLTEVLEHRMVMDLFEEGVAERAIVASGGVIRLLFRIVTEAAVTAGIKGRQKITDEDITRSINKVRADFEARLGDDKEFGDAGTAIAKLDRLVRIYDSPETESIPDDTFASLVKVDAVLEFNGEHWYGLHPLIVDVLDKFRPREEGRRAGGTV